jgi:hypothetical protein
VSIGDRILNESSFPIASIFPFQGRTFNRSHPAFNLQLQVCPACFVSAEAEFEGMIQMLEPETIGTSLVGSIEKGALRSNFGHIAHFRWMNRRYIGVMTRHA